MLNGASQQKLHYSTNDDNKILNRESAGFKWMNRIIHEQQFIIADKHQKGFETF